jgi:hypothetical protein
MRAFGYPKELGQGNEDEVMVPRTTGNTIVREVNHTYEGNQLIFGRSMPLFALIPFA